MAQEGNNLNTTKEPSASIVTARTENPPIGAQTKDPPTENPATGDGKGKRKAMELRAEAWKHFKRIKDENGNLRANCNYCGRLFHCNSKSNGTSSLNYHLTKCKKYLGIAEKQQSQLSFQVASSQGGESEKMGTLANWKFDNEFSRKLLAKLIIIDELPFKYVENEGFREFVVSLQPKFRMISRWTIAKDCYNLYMEEKTKLKTFLKDSCKRISLTTDTRTSLQRINYMCLTAHFIDNDWRLHKKILNFRPIDSHKGDSISRAFEKCLVEWGISNVFTITVDNATSNDQAMKILEKRFGSKDGSILKAKHLHMRCMAHIVNLIVQDGLKDMGYYVDCVRGAVKYVRQSPSRIEKFKECIQMEKIQRKKFLCLDVSTRWNSTYLMLDAAQRFIPAFERFEDLDHMYKIDLRGGKGVPDGCDWEKVKKLVIF